MPLTYSIDWSKELESDDIGDAEITDWHGNTKSLGTWLDRCVEYGVERVTALEPMSCDSAAEMAVREWLWKHTFVVKLLAEQKYSCIDVETLLAFEISRCRRLGQRTKEKFDIELEVIYGQGSLYTLPLIKAHEHEFGAILEKLQAMMRQTMIRSSYTAEGLFVAVDDVPTEFTQETLNMKIEEELQRESQSVKVLVYAWAVPVRDTWKDHLDQIQENHDLF